MALPSSDYCPGITRNPDGSYTRSIKNPCIPATHDLDSNSHVLSKDLPVNPENQTWLRIYLPKQALVSYAPIAKLPIVVYYHGGGFCYMSAASDSIHEFCGRLAVHVAAVVVSVDYRLAPEHRLPAAYEDALEALHWIKTTKDRWLVEFADLSNCFLMGTSAGGNIAYHAGLRAAEEVDDLKPLIIKGLVLHHPFYGGSERTGSEMRLGESGLLNLSGCDLMWKLALPHGEDRDHEYSNPMVGRGSDKLIRVKTLGWRVLLTGCFGDLLIDRQMEFAKMLEEKGIKSVAHFNEGYHTVELFESERAKELFVLLTSFIFLPIADDVH